MLAIRQPAGVVVGIAPWNAPVILGTRAVATPLAYGNTVVLKASEICPRTHAHIARVLVDAGFPAGVVNLITNQPADAADVVDELIVHPGTRRVNFTGSSAVGRIIAEIETIRPAAKGQLVGAAYHSWAMEPFNAGDWAYFGPGQVTTFANVMSAPSGRVHFCGEHTATGNRGLEAALESSERVALEVLSA